MFMRFNSTNSSNLEQNNNNKFSSSSEELLGPDNLTPLRIYLKQAIVGLILGDGTLVYLKKNIKEPLREHIFSMHKEQSTIHICYISLICSRKQV